MELANGSLPGDPASTDCISAGTGVSATSTPGLTGGALTGVIAGAIGAALLLGGGIAYLVYYKVAAARNEKEVPIFIEASLNLTDCVIVDSRLG